MMRERIELVTKDGASRFVDYAFTEGSWSTDNWMPLRLSLKVADLPEIHRITVTGYNPDTSVRFFGNRLTIEIENSVVSWCLPWGESFTLTEDLDTPVAGDLALVLSLENGLVPDALDGRTRGVVLTCIRLHEAA
jgi:hypothetical protein